MSSANSFIRPLNGLPARVNVEQAAALLGFPPHDIPELVARKLLRPLGHPVQNSPKYFATADLLLLTTDVKWLHKATDAVRARWQRKNQKNDPEGGAPT